MLGMGSTVSIAAAADGVAHVGGVSRCASPWACPVCAPTIGERRARELDQAIAAWTAMGGVALFVTATMRHKFGDDLGQLLDLVQKAWSRTWRWKVRPSWYGGQARAVEVVWSARNGWHPHVHAVIFVESGHDLEATKLLVESMRGDWEVSVGKFGGSTRVKPVRDRLTGKLVTPGWHVRAITEAGATANYLTKVEGGWGAGLELARLDLKTGKGLTPVQLLDAAVDGDPRAAVLYGAYERATMGKRRIVTSPGLMKRCGVKELTDDEAALEALDAEPVALALIPSDQWARLLAAGFVGQLLDDVEDMALGVSDGWPWPVDWLVRSPDLPG